MSRAELDCLGRIARAAGEIIMRVYARDFQVDYKGPGDPVTEADRDANQLICERLALEFPDAAIVAEESASQSYARYREHRRVLFVDPLDGTREFVAKNGQFVVMIGLVVDELATLGVVFAPATGTLWCGGRGLGAHVIEPGRVERSIQVSDVQQLDQSRITVSRSRRSESLRLALERIAPADVTPLGSAGLKGARVAEGLADAYLAVGPAGSLWDACAVDALISGAGGRVTDTRGRALDYRSGAMELGHGLLAANPALHGGLLASLTATE